MTEDEKKMMPEDQNSVVDYKYQYCWYVPASTSVYDFIDNNGLSVYGKLTEAQIKAKKPDVEKRLFSEVTEELDLAATEKFVTGPIEITAEEFSERLGVLPPIRWVNDGSVESFRISEATYANIRAIYCRMNDRYFYLCDRDTVTHEQVVQMCKNFIGENNEN